MKTISLDVPRLIACQKKDEIVQGMDSRINDIKQTTSQIEAPPAATLKAITAGTDATKNAAQNAITQKAQQSPLNRFGRISSSRQRESDGSC